MHIAFLIPTTSKGKEWKKFSDSFLSSILISSLNDPQFDITLFLGIDADDAFYNDNDVLSDLLQELQKKNLKLNITHFEGMKKGHLTQMWNVLFDEALKDESIDYFFQCGDDLFFHTQGWLNEAVLKLKSNNDIGVCGPVDITNPKLLTNVLVSRTHKELLSYFFPPEILNWHCDDWVNHVYGLRGHLFRLENHYIENKGGKERYTPLEDKDLNYFDYVERDIKKIPINKTKNMTIVSGFLDIQRLQTTTRPRSLEKYIELGKKFIRLPLHKVVFIDETMLDKFNEPVNEDTRIIPFKFSDLWLFPYLNDILNIELYEPNEKDTHLYNMVILQKTEWVRKAIGLNPFSSKAFGWCDFGILHFGGDNDKFFTRHVLNAISSEKNVHKSRVTTPGWWNINNYKKFPIIPLYQKALWFFCGCMFFGYEKALKNFDYIVKKEVLNALSQKKFTFEVNFWFKIYTENPEIFRWYGTDHNYKHTMFSELAQIQPKDKVGIVITTFNRPEYLSTTFQSLKESCLNEKLPFEVELVIVDDCSDNEETKKLIDKFELQHIQVTKYTKNTNSGVFNSLKEGFDYILTKGCDVLMNLDSDVIVKKDFLIKLKTAFDSLTFEILTGYNSKSHISLKHGDNHVQKKTLGGINMVFSPRTYMEIVRPCFRDTKFDWYISACVEKIIALSPSVIQHIGYNGMNSLNNEKFDISVDFN